MRTIQKKLDPGKWRIKLVSGHVVSVRLIGMRDRRHFLNEWPKSDFYAHCRNSDTVVNRGVPLAWFQEGPWLLIWPSPAHEWQIEYDIQEKADERVYSRQAADGS